MIKTRYVSSYVGPPSLLLATDAVHDPMPRGSFGL